MNCQKCGSELTEGSKFCQNCGAKVGQTENTNEAQESTVAKNKITDLDIGQKIKNYVQSNKKRVYIVSNIIGVIILIAFIGVLGKDLIIGQFPTLALDMDEVSTIAENEILDFFYADADISGGLSLSLINTEFKDSYDSMTLIKIPGSSIPGINNSLFNSEKAVTLFEFSPSYNVYFDGENVGTAEVTVYVAQQDDKKYGNPRDIGVSVYSDVDYNEIIYSKMFSIDEDSANIYYNGYNFVFCVEYTYNNITTETENPYTSFNIKAFQNGIELDYYYDNVFDGDVQSGSSITNTAKFDLINTSDDILIQILPWLDYNEGLVYMQYSYTLGASKDSSVESDASDTIGDSALCITNDLSLIEGTWHQAHNYGTTLTLWFDSDLTGLNGRNWIASEPAYLNFVLSGYDYYEEGQAMWFPTYNENPFFEGEFYYVGGTITIEVDDSDQLIVNSPDRPELELYNAQFFDRE